MSLGFRSFNGAAPARARSQFIAVTACTKLPRFNGAAPARARSLPLSELLALAQKAASMGPRPRGRGVDGLRAGNAHNPLASMGPRPRGRGVCIQNFGSRLDSPGFNGAAPARARSRQDARVGVRSVPLQWGRARAGAESGLPHSRIIVLICKLQWGRARAGAESRLPHHFAHAANTASMGPRPRGRGVK